MTGVTTPRLSLGTAAGVTFVAAACVLVLEIAAGRLLAPYVGVSLTTYTGIIGVILGGIALGAWLGGRAADAFGPERLLGPALVAGGWAAIASVPIVTVVGAARLGGGGVLEIVTLATLGFVLPATLLSAVAPMIVRATIEDVTTSGTLVGRLSAVGTAGAIVGTFLTGFVLLGLLPTRVLIVGAGAIVVLIGLGLWWRLGRSRAPVGLALIATIALAAGAVVVPSPCDRETAYYCVDVQVDIGDPAGRFLILDGLTHAYVDTADPTELRFGYIRRFADAAGPTIAARGPVEALHVGGGGFSFPRYLQAIGAAGRQTVLELDPAVLDVARTELGLRTSADLAVHVGDARLSIERLPSDAYDLAFGDAFGGLAVPWHLTTGEFLGEVDRVLRPDGTYVMNLIDYPPFGFVRAETATARSLFEHVAVVAGFAVLEGRGGGNVVLIASHAPIDLDGIRSRIDGWGEGLETTVVGDEAAIAAFVDGAPVLTDDYAPVDQLLGR